MFMGAQESWTYGLIGKRSSNYSSRNATYEQADELIVLADSSKFDQKSVASMSFR